MAGEAAGQSTVTLRVVRCCPPKPKRAGREGRPKLQAATAFGIPPIEQPATCVAVAAPVVDANLELV